MEGLKSTVTQVPLAIENKGDDIDQLLKNGIEKENQWAELDHEPISNVLEEARHVIKKVDRSYFAKFCPSTNLEARIGEAEKLIEKLNQHHSTISRKLEERKLVQGGLVSQLKQLNYQDSRHKDSVTCKRENLDLLQLTLDKLCFPNNAYRGRATKSCSSQKKGELDLLQVALDKLYSEDYAYKGRARNSCSSSHDELDKHKLRFRMLHGKNNLVEEKKLLKEINGSHKKTSSSHVPLNELNDAISVFHFRGRPRWGLGWQFVEPTRDQKEKIGREKKELVYLKERAIATAAVKGKLWNSLGSKQAIHNQAKLIATELDGIRKEIVLPLRASAKPVEKELNKIEKNVKYLQKQLTLARKRKNEAYEWILELRKLRAEE
ncbi:hypothetical protein F2P56_001855, partial [Juglans regia]